MYIKMIEKKLEKLKADTQAQFGIMTPQHMVEHLTVTIKISYNRIKIPEFELSEKQKFQKTALLDTSIEFPQGVKAPGMNVGELMALRSSNLKEAKEQLLASLTDYNTFFEMDPTATTIHPRFSKLNYAEWERFHPKHFKHHFKQFGIWE
ncbi:DinB family protein [Algoriphagus antarcticus]|uniref:Oxepin-CoA hydrolase/3-oxo-5,6-dehydrosuberyl-CoA semialdehyde dehydrogenase n=1 Tax=Algoriphagus antarcticus TaxID=238540 RepID=A0A3E0D9T4_9BACT|nr:hypothetical protein [Algoriphagus antarcticus]REG78308.1 hypothetical protein C8N25_1361 [Algoriphagus antarcticus]